MRALLVVLTLLLLAPETLAGGSVWDQKKVVVYSAVSANLQPTVAETIVLLNAMLPGNMPVLIYSSEAEAPCESIAHRRGIVVCETEELAAGIIGETLFTSVRGTLRGAEVQIHAGIDLPQPQTVLCHEFFHALTGTRSHGDWVNLRPCPFDVAAAQRAYRKNRHHR